MIMSDVIMSLVFPKLVTKPGYTQHKAADELGITAVTLRAWLKKRCLLEPVQVIEQDDAASTDPKLLKSRIRELYAQPRQ